MVTLLLFFYLLSKFPFKGTFSLVLLRWKDFGVGLDAMMGQRRAVGCKKHLSLMGMEKGDRGS